MMLKEPILRDPAWLKHVRTLPCVVTGYRWVEGADMGVDPAHIRWGFHGAGMKPPDNHVLPLRHDLHVLQHQMGEPRFWEWHMPELIVPQAEYDDATPDEIMRALIAYAEKLYEKYRG